MDVYGVNMSVIGTLLVIYYLFYLIRMIFGQLPGRSPEGKIRSMIKSINQVPLYHMTCLQLSKMKLHYDDVIYHNSIISKAVIMGRIIHHDQSTSARGLPVINIMIEDSTGRCLISFYHSQDIEEICHHSKSYVKISLNVKCGGLVYKPEIKMMGISIVQLTHFNQLTAHYLQCMKTSLKTQ